MTVSHVRAVVVAALLISSLSAYSEAPENLVVNSQFEGILPTGVPSDWRLMTVGEFPGTLEAANRILTTTPFDKGGNVVTISLDSPRSYGIVQGISCSKDQVLKLSIWMKGEGLKVGGESGVRVIFSNWKERSKHAEARAASFVLKPAADASEWRQYEKEFAIPEVASSLQLELGQRGDQGTLSFAAPSLTVPSGSPGKMSDPAGKNRFRKQNASVPAPESDSFRVVFIGDSITEGWSLSKSFPEDSYINRGIGGQISAQILDRMEQDVFALHPQVVWLLAGTNDIGASIPNSWIVANIAAMARLCHQRGVVLIVASVLPVGDSPTDPQATQTHQRPPGTILKLNQKLEEVCRTEGATFLDLHRVLSGADGLLPKTLSKDGLHLNEAGYARIAPLVQEAIEAIRSKSNSSNEPPLVLPKPTHHVTIREELIGHHPRIFFDAEKRDALRKKMADPRLAFDRNRFLDLARKFAAQKPPTNPPNTEDPFRDFGNRLPILAFAYLMTGDADFLRAAREWITALNGYPSWAGDKDLGAGHVSFGMALAYDWLYHDLTPTEREAIQASLYRHGKILLERSTGPDTIGTWWGWAYFQNHSWINHTGIAAIAMALYESRPEEMQAWLDYTRTQFQTTYKNFGIDGSNFEGPLYAIYGAEWLLHYIQALQSVSGEDLTDMAFLKQMGTFMRDTTMPDFRNVANFGDCGPLGRGGLGDSIYLRLAGLYGDRSLEAFRQKRLEALGPDNSVPSVFDLISSQPELTPSDWKNVPLVGLYPDRGLVIFRTGWTPDAAVVTFLCGPPGGKNAMKNWFSFPKGSASFSHANPDANTFLFWADEEWKIGDPAGYNWDKKTRYENTWTVDGKGQRGGEGNWFTSTSYLGDIPQAHLVTVATSTEADYVVGEAASAYEPECELTEYRRHLLFVKNESPYLVIFDRLAARKEQPWATYLHAYNPFDAVTARSFEIPGRTKTYGTVLGPGTMTLESGPLSVTIPGKKVVERGYEMEIKPESTDQSTWLVTVIGMQKAPVRVIRPGPHPVVEVGSDRIEWAEDDSVSLNGKALSGNLLKDH